MELEQARSHVEQVQELIEEQVILIDRLRSDGHDTASADRLLANFIWAAWVSNAPPSTTSNVRLRSEPEGQSKTQACGDRLARMRLQRKLRLGGQF